MISLLVLVSTASPALAQSGAVIRVDADASGASTGASWSDAVPDLQEALRMAAPGDELWIAKGTYLPTAAGDRDASFRIDRPLSLYGGFTGRETRRTERNPELHRTILSGAIGSSAREDNARVVVAVELPFWAMAALDGIEIREGHDERYPSNGAGLSLTGGLLLFENSGVHDCRAERGGGIYVGRNAFLWVIRGSFRGNQGDYGGAIQCRGDMIVQGSTFLENRGGAGGAIVTGYFGDPSEVEISDCEFRGNTAFQSGGALDVFCPASVRVERCRFLENRSWNYGGAISVATEHPEQAFFRDCLIEANEAEYYGGGIYAYSSVAIDRCRIVRNRGLVGGGLCVESLDHPMTVSNCLIASNEAGAGGGVYGPEYSATLALAHCTIVGNVARFGAGVLNPSSHCVAILVNSIVWGNLASQGGDLLLQQFYDLSRTMELEYCAIEGWLPGGIGSNTGAYPRFVDPANGDFRLRADSPLIDAGHPNAAYYLAGRSFDLETEPRLRGVAVDIGADEAQ